ncbi:thioredoxin family protein [Komagataeibacter sp. FNDCF1]|uniref:thioredoxin family protein n=1 Tax=Komagataeibacter sp. FNDCF1 TaxID=2878681 RepID=UPI001E51E9B7|nr:thioredoxin family protein [Komagataeibacter sp. FNDCF1]MCE2563479.1 thioredoxin family protein [Komagataeibacter sp. FNDCF1]
MNSLHKTGLMAALCLALGYAAPVAQAAPAPAFGPGPIVPVSHPYGPATGARQSVDAAFRQARQTGRNVLLDFGANWCPDCRILAGVLAQPAVAAWVQQHFVVVTINVDRAAAAEIPTAEGERFNSNADIARTYGVTVSAIPAVLVLTPTGQLVNRDKALVLGNARTLSGQAVVDQLNEWAQHS